MRRLFDQKNSEKGMVTIEATLSLTTFLFVFITLFSIITICRTQARVQVALNSTAKEISQYTYVYGLTGLDGSLAGFQQEANNQKTELNGLVKDTIEVFDQIQLVDKNTEEAVNQAKQTDISDADAVLAGWENVATVLDQGIDDVKASADKVKSDIEDMAKDPQKLLFGMARLLASESLEIAKSRIVAEPVTRALIQKHLKRTDKDTADAYCRAMGILPGTYLGKESSFNGIDFSNSTLFPYGSPEITLIATYKMKLIQLLPINIEFTITQSARTLGWLHGDKTNNSAAEIVQTLKEDKTVDKSVWNSQSVNDRNKTIRTLELDELKSQGYLGVSGETYIQAYHEGTNTFAFIAMCNPVYGVDSVDEIDGAAVQDQIKRLVAQMNSSTDNRESITVKKKDSKGNVVTDKITCSDVHKTKKIVLIVPEDAGVKEYVQNVINTLGYTAMFKVEAKYGTGYKLPDSQ